MKLLKLAAVSLVVSLSAFADDDIPAVWKSKCQSCHGADGKAQTKQGKKLKIDDMTAGEWQTKWSDEKMKKVINEGVKDTKMESFKAKLSPEEIDGLIKHIRSFKG